MGVLPAPRAALLLTRRMGRSELESDGGRAGEKVSFLSKAIIAYRSHPVKVRSARVGSGDPTSLEPFVAHTRRAFHGMCMLIVSSVAGQTGEIEIRASADALSEARATAIAR